MPKKTKTTASSVMWRFVANDDIVVHYLPAEQVREITTWQESTEFRFEFHEGHTSGGGKPLYIRPSALDESREGNIPKLNTGGVAPVSIGSINNSDDLKSLKDRERTELLNIITTNWAALQTIAKNYWEKKPVPAPAQVRPEKRCSCGANFSGDVDLGPPNAFGKYHCTRCKKFNAK